MAMPLSFPLRTDLRCTSGYPGVTGNLRSGAGFVTAADGPALQCGTAGGATITVPDGNYYYINTGGHGVSCTVRALDATIQPRTLVEKGGFTLWLSDADGHVAYKVGSVTLTTNVNILDGQPHHIAASWQNSNPTGPVRIWIDGVLAASTTVGVDGAFWADSVATSLTIGYSASRSEAARALIRDVRLWNDPIFPNELTMLATTPAWERLIGEYRLDETHPGSGKVLDSSPSRRHLTPTPNASYVAGASGQALAPTSNSGPAATWTGPPFATDRICILGRVKLTTTTPGTLLEILDGTGTVRLKAESFGGGRLRWTAIRDNGSGLTYESTGVELSTSSWTYVQLVAYNGGLQVLPMADWPGSDSGSGAPPAGLDPLTNLPVFSDLRTIRVGGGATTGVGAWDDLRIVANFLSTGAGAVYQSRPIDAAVPPVAGFFAADGSPLTPWLLTDEGLVELGIGAPPAPDDTTAPSVPTGLAASSITDDGFTVTWSPSTDPDPDDDTTAPTVPTGLAASAITDTGFTATWEASTDG
ncbi:LamG-like jellyroll fold domain-containing protein [Mumia sp. DW29H23]|uniref:LamG-like jellyroll fold domain-containing protein n=1 Tax=Mumia sp. DW29H23 TaxID=3421241 RepID=UPI003D699DF9